MGIYAIQVGNGPIKIGFTDHDPRKRLAAVQNHHHRPARLVGFIPGDRADEKRLHKQFAEAHIRGEWFCPKPDILKFIRNMGLPVFPDNRGMKQGTKRPNYHLPREQAKRMNEASIAARTKGRMPQRQALVHWRNPELTAAQALKRMKGWSRGVAYKVLGQRNVPSGRPQTSQH